MVGVLEYVCRKRIKEGVEVFQKQLSDCGVEIAEGSKLFRRLQYARFVFKLQDAAHSPSDPAPLRELLALFDLLVPESGSGSSAITERYKARTKILLQYAVAHLRSRQVSLKAYVSAACCAARAACSISSYESAPSCVFKVPGRGRRELPCRRGRRL